jgi:hypothetical protein
MFADVPNEEAARMLGGNAIEYFRLDAEALSSRKKSAAAVAGS